MSGYDYLIDSIKSFIDRNNYVLVDYVNNWAPRGSVSIRLFYKVTEESNETLIKDFEF